MAALRPCGAHLLSSSAPSSTSLNGSLPHLTSVPPAILLRTASSSRLVLSVTTAAAVHGRGPVLYRQGQVRHATFLRRPKRPYTFTQLVTLSDGSSYLHRTSSPVPIHKATKDQRNSPLWNPSLEHLRVVEADAAGRLRAFRARFGRGWDAAEGSAPEVAQEAAEAEQDGMRELRGGAGAVPGDLDAVEGQRGRVAPDPRPATGDSLLDLISGYKLNEDVEKGLKRGRQSRASKDDDGYAGKKSSKKK